MTPANFTRGKPIDIIHLRNIKHEDKDPYEFAFFHDCQVILIKKASQQKLLHFLKYLKPLSCGSGWPLLSTDYSNCCTAM